MLKTKEIKEKKEVCDACYYMRHYRQYIQISTVHKPILLYTEWVFRTLYTRKRLCIIIDWWWKRDAAHKRARSLDRRDGNALGLCSDVTSWEWVCSVCEGCDGCLKGYIYIIYIYEADVYYFCIFIHFTQYTVCVCYNKME